MYHEIVINIIYLNREFYLDRIDSGYLGVVGHANGGSKA
jgi:hypothetical protein